MKYIYIGFTIIMIFLFWKHSFQIQVFLEKQFNNLQVCNNTEYDISHIRLNWYRSPSPSVSFIWIQSWKCSTFKKSYWLDNKTNIIIQLRHNEELYRFENSIIDPHWFKMKTIWTHTLYIENLNISGKIMKMPLFWIQQKWD